MNDLFILPVEEKLKFKAKCKEDVGYHGYGFGETTRECGSEEWCDRFNIITSPLAQRKMHYWPDNPAQFRKIMEEYSIKAEKLMEQVLKGMARSLNLPDDNSFVEEMGSEPRISATFNLFPTCSRPDRVLGVNNHTDASVLTFLVQDKQVEGLQLLLDDGEWVRVPTTPSDALVISIGDQGEIMSNGKFKSRIHRATVNMAMSRKTLGLFCIPELDKTIGPAKGLVNGTTSAAKYNKVTNYELDYFKVTYNRTAIESLKL
ncbi:Jasmonate-induced oxygenase 4 [Linum perenne]